MILLREIQERDLDAIEAFSQIPGFINLPNDKDLLREKIMRSIDSFNDRVEEFSDGKYLFIAEDTDTGRVLGTSMIAAQHGTADSPHFYFQIGSEEKYSEAINTGFIHGTLELKLDTNGPSEIGGLVLNPEYRNSDERLGRQISFVRFLFLALNRKRFRNRVIAELLPPLNKRGQSPLWEAIGRRFTNMDYWEADQLCQKNKDFILSLFPSGKIYTTFFPAEARNALGKVGKDTEPVVHMLKKIGFEYKHQVDPFDGGPHLWADVENLVPVKKLGNYVFEPGNVSNGTAVSGLLCRVQQPKGVFRAIAVHAEVESGKIQVQEPKEPKQNEAIQSALNISKGDTVAFMPYY
jgi:arginine N-succinyltransferase